MNYIYIHLIFRLKNIYVLLLTESHYFIKTGIPVFIVTY
nr:MAG TPA: hypothetical protein [Crassvirales sp.]